VLGDVIDGRIGIITRAVHSNQQVADNLTITVGTAKSHLHRIFGELSVRNRIAAAARFSAI